MNLLSFKKHLFVWDVENKKLANSRFDWSKNNSSQKILWNSLLGACNIEETVWSSVLVAVATRGFVEVNYHVLLFREYGFFFVYQCEEVHLTDGHSKKMKRFSKKLIYIWFSTRGKVQIWNPQHLSTSASQHLSTFSAPQHLSISAPQHLFSTSAPFQHLFITSAPSSVIWYLEPAFTPLHFFSVNIKKFSSKKIIKRLRRYFFLSSPSAIFKILLHKREIML